MKRPLVSVIIPTYNADKYIKEALESVFKQTYTNTEIIVIDDGSTDNTKEVLTPYLDRIQYIYKENGGPASARNLGIKMAKGEYIAFLDADDIWLKEKLETQIKEMNDGIGLVGCKDHTINGRIKRTRNISYKELLIKNVFSNSSVLVRRECIDRVGLFDERPEFKAVEDWDMWIRISKRCKATYINKTLVRIRSEANGISSPSNAKKMLSNEMAVIRKHLKWHVLLKMQVYSSRYFYAGWAYFVNGDIKDAFIHEIKSLLYSPFSILSKNHIGLIVRIFQSTLGNIYGKFFRDKILPFYETFLRKRRTLLYLKELEKNQWCSREDLLRKQQKELMLLLYHSYQNVPYYQKIFKRLKLKPKDMKSYDDFRKLPVISKEDIKNNRESMIAENFRDRLIKKATGGSTGVPLQFAHDRDSYDWRVAVAMRGYKWAGCEDGRKVLYIWGASIGAESIFKKHKKLLHNFILRKKILNSFHLNKIVMDKYLKELNKFKPEAIVGYTTPLYNFAKFIKDSGKECVRVKSIISAAEKLYEYQRELIEEVFRGKVFNTYGNREFMLIGAECEKHNGLHLNVDNLYVEILKDGEPVKDGEIGEVVITDLHNYAMPFIRYKTGDLAVYSERKCDCGRGLPLIEDVEGRILDTIQTLDGKFVPGEFFPHLMKEFEEVEKFQVSQKSKDRVNLKIINKKPLKRDRLDFLKKEICKVLGDKTELNIDFVDDIPLADSGKFRVAVSEVPIDFKN
ncbi:glycosyltransferase [bacterium]|nr:glycosyltransferase [bacterium]